MSNRFFISLLVLTVLAGACSDDGAALDPALDDNPIVFNGMELSHFLVDTDTISVVPGQDKSPDDVVTIPLRVQIGMWRREETAQGATLRCTVRLDGKSQVLAEQTITGARVGTHAFPFDIELRRGDVGDYRIEVTGDDEFGAASAEALGKMRVIFGTKPPEILELDAPDTLRLQAQTVALDMSVLVRDDSGPADIKQVFFNSFLPDGRPSTGNPFLLRDNGNPNNGDKVFGDGWYSIRVQLPPDAMKGEYEFQFRALDYSNASSNVVIHKLIIL